jgi:uncharacterized membrane protein YcaP (DUF421 family)
MVLNFTFYEFDTTFFMTAPGDNTQCMLALFTKEIVMFFDDWFGLVRVLIMGVATYGALIFWLRISGKRTLSKWNAFDFIVTIAIGSTLATVILSNNIALAEGVLAFFVLIALQSSITWLVVRSTFLEKLIKAKPTLLLIQGNLLYEALKKQRVTTSEVLAAVRGAGFAAIEDVAAVVLETDGSFSVIKKSTSALMSALDDIPEYRKRDC